MDALKKNYPEYLEDEGIKWDFTKFLIDHEGNVVERYEPNAEFSRMLDKEKSLIQWIKNNKIKILNSGIKIAA